LNALRRFRYLDGSDADIRVDSCDVSRAYARAVRCGTRRNTRVRENWLIRI
jgi:hypothetical protein